jgi:predicted RNase H-like HicB family nuclease
MKFSASVHADEHGEYVAECDSLGVSAHGLSPANALDALREEIRYRVELCPCSTVGDDWVELVVEK